MLFKIGGMTIATGADRAPEHERARSFDEIIASLDGGHYGPGVGKTRAVQVAAFFACANVLAEAIATPRIRIYDGSDDKATPVPGHPIATLLNTKPNKWQSGFEFREVMAWHAIIDEGGFAYINRVGEYIELLPLMPGTCRPVLDDDWNRVYDVRLGGEVIRMSADKIFHFGRVAFNGSDSLNIISSARAALGLAVSAEDAQTGIYENGGRIAGVLSTEQKLSEERLKFINEAFKKAYSGGHNAFKTAILDGGFKFYPMSSSADDLQTIETRRFAVEEICRFMNVYPQVVMQSANTSTHSSAESFFDAQVRQSFGPWWRRFEGAVDRDLLDDDGPVEARIDRNTYTRASTKDRSEFYRTVVELGIMTPNEARAAEGLPPLPGLDEPLKPLNLTSGGDNEGGSNAED